MTFLLDTNILCEMRRRTPNRGAAQWFAHAPGEQLHLSVLSLGEIRGGIIELRKRGDQAQAAALETWFAELVAEMGDRIIPVTAAIARIWGGQQENAVSALIAATAQAHGWTLVTRNVKDFEHTGVRVLNPFSE